jgi:hypothetical protein
MKVNTLANTPTFTLTSWGNGVAYSLVNHATKQEVYVQGDDADEFIILYGRLIENDANQALKEIWNEYDAVASNLGE